MNSLLQDAIAPELVRARAQEIVAGLRSSTATEGWLERWFERWNLGRQLGSWVIGNERLVLFGLYVLAAGVVIGLLVLILRQVEWSRAREPGLLDANQAKHVRERVESLLARARAARQANEKLLALRLYFGALVVGLSRRGDLELRDGWTNHELVQRGAQSEKLRATLMPLVLELDGLVYGGRPISEAHLDSLERMVEGIRA